MLTVALIIAMVAVALAMVMNVIRFLRGPAPEDRVIALDTIYINAIAMIVLLGMWLDSRLYFEAALLIALMGFIGTIALAKYLRQGNLVD